ncbi:hypothetical protein AGRA3207_003481 [Actinomadura graeca]|uniref:DUF6895 domain-containing protein n=1 Tax=Actinomadura graeca TaxID=2750812 RepID=A0ABX8R0C1_9ACTN|nr:hypothetical protein [Actinomadura graeca]QXJ22478.1 hypothetical protein AGRA3207_003481 [Actinomadura graeca]
MTAVPRRRFGRLDDDVREALSTGPPGGDASAPAAEADVRDLGERALLWCTQRLPFFDPRRRRPPAAPDAFPEGPLLELVILGRLAAERGGFGPVTRLETDRALDLAAEVFAGPACQERFARVHALFPHYAALAILLERTGRTPVPHLNSYLRDRVAAAGGSTHALARTAAGLLELRYYLDLGRVEHLLPPVGDLIGRSLLAERLSLCHLSDLDAYAITHVIFAVTDMGARPYPRGETVGNARALVRLLLAEYVAWRNWDLTAELLLCWRALGLPPDGLTDVAWRCLQGAQHPDGLVPGPHHDPRDGGAPGQVFATCYHTTLVTAMAAIVWEAPDAS